MAQYEHLGKAGVVWLLSKIKTALGEKVDKVDGKVLSTNDYTKADKDKLAAFGNATDYSKTTEIESLITGKGYQTATQVNTAITVKGYQTSSQVQSLINNSLSGITGIDFNVVTSLPATGVSGVIYLVLHSHSDGQDNYDEFIWLTDSSKYEKIGNTDIDLSGYLKSSDIVDITETELNAMWNS